MQYQITDQAALGYLLSQTTHIEREVYNIVYPEIQYPSLIPVDTSANEWANTVTYFSMDRIGQAAWFDANARDVPLAEVEGTKYNTTVAMAAIGYGWNMEEIAQAQQLNRPLETERASAARLAYEKFMDNVLMFGDTAKGYQGLTNHSAITATTAATTGTGATSTWSTKTADNILADINGMLSLAYTTTRQVEMMDTVLLPVARMLTLANARMPDGVNETIMSWISRNNSFTAVTSRPLTIRGVRGLETAGAGGTARMIGYRRAPDVLKAHIPMPLRFWPAMQVGPMLYQVPGTFRTGGLDIRKTGSVAYVDAI